MAFSVRAQKAALCGKPAARAARAARVVVRAEAPAAKEAASAPWTAPELDASTPSPIFGGSTGGLLRKAQVRANMRFVETLSCRHVDGTVWCGRACARHAQRSSGSPGIAPAVPAPTARPEPVFGCTYCDILARGRAGAVFAGQFPPRGAGVERDRCLWARRL